MNRSIPLVIVGSLLTHCDSDRPVILETPNRFDITPVRGLLRGFRYNVRGTSGNIRAFNSELIGANFKVPMRLWGIPSLHCSPPDSGRHGAQYAPQRC